MRYKVRAFSTVEGLHSDERTAANLDQLRVELEAEGKTLISARQVVTFYERHRLGRLTQLVFCKQLLALLKAGMQLTEAIDTLAANEQDLSQKEVLTQVQISLRSGQSFSQALKSFPAFFSPLLFTAIEASEQTGAVSEALERFISYEGRLQALRSRLIGALVYPAFLLTLGVLVVIFLLAYVVPRFSAVFADRLQDMPLLSGLVIRLGLWVTANPWFASLAAVGVLMAGSFLLTVPATRNWIVGVICRVPWLSHRIREFELVRIYRSLGMLLRGGVPALRSLQMITGLVPPRSRRGIERTITLIREGLPVSGALYREGFTTVVSERLLSVGERSGQIGAMLEEAANFLDDDLDRAVERAVRLAEPLIMVVIGVLIGGIVMLMYLPIFELAEGL